MSTNEHQPPNWLQIDRHPTLRSQPHRLVPPFNWHEHIPFAMLLVDMVRPATIVELGTHTGNSYCAFCQAVQELELDTRCYAVDTWQGDEQTGFYGSEVLRDLRAHHDPRYSSFSRLLQSTFDDALAHFADGTVDLLHIDGYHTYEGVSHDFHSWLPKMSTRGVMLMHDINVRERDFGVWRLWNEVKQSYTHFEFLHGHGLGVLAVGEINSPELQAILYGNAHDVARTREFFFGLGRRLSDEIAPQAQAYALRLQLEAREKDIEILRNQVIERELRLVEAMAKYDADTKAYQQWIAERDQQLAQSAKDRSTLENWVRERDAVIQQNRALIETFQNEIALLTIQVTERDQLVEKSNADIATLTTWLKERNQQLLHVETELHRIQTSFGWRLLLPLWRLRQRVLPSNGVVLRAARLVRRAGAVWRQKGNLGLAKHSIQWLRRRHLRGYSTQSSPASQESSDNQDSYAVWIAEHEPDEEELRRQSLEAQKYNEKPLISVLTPVYNPSPSVLIAMIESVLKQTYPYWELRLVNGSSDNQDVSAILRRFEQQDERIHVVTLNKNLGIVENTNAGVSHVQGSFVAFVDHDDTLAPFALFEVAKFLQRHPQTDLVYSDHDILSPDGSQRMQPLFKPDWSPAIMLSANYATHLCVVRTHLLQDIGGLTRDSDGAQDWDLILRISERTREIGHIPKVLYHWRDVAGSTATDIKQKPYVMRTQTRIITQHLSRRGIDAHTYFDDTGYLRVKWPVTGETKVSIIIPSRNLQMARRCITSILNRTSYRAFEIILVDTSPNGSLAQLAKVDNDQYLRVISYSQPFNYSAVNNVAARQSHSQALLFLNDDTEVLESDWLDEMVRWVELDEIGVVGVKLLHADGRIQHAGVVVGLNGFADHPFAGSREHLSTIYGRSEWYRNYSAVTGACLMIRRELFERIGGFDEQLVLCGNDVDLCLRVRALGYQVLYTPFARLLHLENATRGASAIPPGDYIRSYAAYQDLLMSGDPYFNPNLSTWSTTPQFHRRGEQPSIDFVRHFLTQLNVGDVNQNVTQQQELHA